MHQLPILLDHPRAWRSYLGGALLDELLGDDTQHGDDAGHFPEEWIISAVQAANPGREHLAEGLARVAVEQCDNMVGVDAHIDPQTAPTLKSLIEADPTALLGAAHTAKFGAQMGVLVKLIDSAERLTIQVHPDRKKARELFDSAYGKTECWHILGTKEIDGQTPCVYFGFKEGITRARWQELFFSQDIPAMLDCLHCCPVQVGDTIFIEGGVPHAIGAGCFLVEIQEPTDYTLRTERTTPSGFAVADALCHQGLGFEKMFDNFHYDGYTEEEVRAKWFLPSEVLQCTPVQHALDACREDACRPSGRPMTAPTISNAPTTPCENIERLLVGGAAASAFFSMKEYLVCDALSLSGSDSFSGLYVLEGTGCYESEAGEIALAAPAQYFIPANGGDFTLKNTGDAPLRVLQFWGPAASADAE